MPPTTVSHFELLEKLGDGGMGTVYKARDQRLGRVVALKFLSARLLDSPEEHARLRHEALALSSLSHPHVATVFEVDELDGNPFLALEYLGGGTLTSRIRSARGRLHPSLIVSWAIDLASGLDHAHRHGVIHRDVKSSNVMFDSEGRIKLTDFGLAQSPRDRDLGNPPRIEGTIGYLAPEQLEGSPSDARSDLFSFGVLLFEMATGTLPFPGKDRQEVIAKALSGHPRRLRGLRPDLPPGLEAIILRLLEKKPEDRYSAARHVTQALRALDLPSPDNVPTEPLLQPFKAPARFDRRWFALLAVAIIGLIGWMYADQVLRWISRKQLPDRKHVAVLPFRSIGGDTGQQALCDGITETLTTALTKHGSFSVVPATDSRKLQSAGDARREFGVNLVIASTVQRRGDQLRVIISLIDAVTLRQIDAETIDCHISKLHDVEDTVIAKISDLLNVSAIEPANPFHAGASQLPSAYDAYLRGRGFLYRWDKAGNYDRAKEQFESSARLDPKFALALVGLADTHLGLYRLRRDAAELITANAAAADAIRLNPQLAGGHITLGAILAESDQLVKAAAELELATKLDPRDPSAYRELARIYRAQKRHREAEQTYKRAIAMRPGDWAGFSNLGSYYLSRQRIPEAETQLRKVIELAPDNHLGYRNLGVAIHLGGRDPKQAEAMFRKAIALNPTGRSYNNLGALLMFHERYREAVPVMQTAAQLALDEGAGDFKAFGNLGDAYQLSSDSPEKAKQAWRQALEIVEKRAKAKPADVELLAVKAIYEAKLGDTGPALRDMTQALLMAPELPAIHYMAALTCAVAGLQDRSLEELRVAARQGYPLEEIRRAPELSRFRALPAFERILTDSASTKQ